MLRRSFVANAFAFAAAGSIARAADLPVLHIATSLEGDVAPLLYAQSSGMFAQLGISVEVAKLNILSIAIAHSRGIPLKIVAPGGLYTSSSPNGRTGRSGRSAYSHRAQSQWKDACDFRAQRFAHD
jgi:hypothetical protein